MNGSRKIIFSTIFSHLLESFSPHISLALSNIDRISSTENEIPEDLIGDFFNHFPRFVPLYSEIIGNLTQIAGTDLVDIVHFLTKALKDILNGKQSIFSGIQNLCVAYDSNNRDHELFLYYFSILFITDLISQIVANFDCSESANVLSRSGYNVTASEQFIPQVNIIIVKQWSVIFSILSEKNYQVISQIFTLFTSDSDLTLPLLLMRFIRLDVEDALGIIFFGQIYDLLKTHLKKKNLTNLILESVAHMLYTLPFNDEIYSKLYALIYPLRTDKSLWRGTVVLLTVIFMRYTKIWPKSPHFYHKRVFGIIGDKTKVEVSLKCFEMSIMGRNVKSECVFWEWGPNPRASSLSFIQFNSTLVKNQIETSSFTSIFMKYYYPKADFTVCPRQFCYTIVHLASLDFNHFVQNLVPKFMELHVTDPRFCVFLMTVPLLNGDDFIQHSFSKVTKDDIKNFNNLLHDKIYHALIKNAPDPNCEHGVCIREVNFLMDSLIDESNQKMREVLEEWGVTSFSELPLHLVKSKPPASVVSLMAPLLSTLEFVLTNEDLSKPEVISNLLEWSCNWDNKVASVAYRLCSDWLTKQTNPRAFIDIITKMRAAHREPETTFITMSLMFQLFKNMNYQFDEETLHEVECTAFIILSSAYPVTRHLGIMILKNVSERIGSKSLFYHIVTRMPKIEKATKAKILLYSKTIKPEIEPPPASAISLPNAVLSQYYGIWLFFLSELFNSLICANFTPLFNIIDKFRDIALEKIMKRETKNEIGDSGFIMMLLSSQYHLKTLLTTNYFDFSNKYEEFPSNSEDKRQKVCHIIHSLLSSNDPEKNRVGFIVLRHLNFSLQSPMIDVLAAVRPELYDEATRSVALIIRQPEINKKFFKHNLVRIISFLTNVQYNLIKKDLNSSRLIQWTDESQKRILNHFDYIRNFCLIVQTTFRAYNEIVSIQDWPMAHRTVIIRFFVNWALTTLPELQVLRQYASQALVMIAKVGPFFQDNFYVNDIAIEFFGNLERHEMPILYNLLRFHLQILLPNFIDACFTQPRAIADLFFEAIVQCADNKLYDFMLSMSGQILFLAHVYSIKEHPHASLLIDKFLSLTERMELVPEDESLHEQAHFHESLPSIFTYATETVFAAFFRIMKMKNLHIPINDIIEAIKPWMLLIRLLPKQTTIIIGSLPRFNCFTPYEFLCQLMDITESVDDDQFRMMVSLWVILWKSPDHTDLIPQFLSEWDNFATKKRIFEILYESDNTNLPERTAHRCSFAFYFHVTRWRHHTFRTEEQWMGLLLANIFHRNWASMKQYFPHIIHFTFVFRERGSKRLFDILCRNLRIECFEGTIPPPIMRRVVREFLKLMNQKSTTDWGNEALQWFLGCPDINFANLSFLIYNQILKPFDEELVGLVIKIVAYHIDNSSSDTKNLCYLVSESFKFFDLIFEKHETVAFNYAVSFLDVRLFIENSLRDAMPIFLKSIRSGYQNKIDNQTLISIIRPLIPVLESDLEAQNIIDELIKKYDDNYELKMIAAPIKMDIPELFPSSPSFDDVFQHASETSLCKSLVHYSMMIQNASYRLQNSIYKICSKIVEKIKVNDNNKVSLAKIYQVGLRSMSRCSSALDLLKVICIHIPDVSDMSVYDVFEWDRNLEDVSRNLKILAKKVEIVIQNVTITECKEYKNIANVLFTDQIPKILPYAAQEEMIESMRRLKRDIQDEATVPQTTHKSLSFSKDPFGSPLYSIPNSLSVVFTDSSKGELFDLPPLMHPKKIKFDKKGAFNMDILDIDKSRMISAEEFLKYDISD